MLKSSSGSGGRPSRASAAGRLVAAAIFVAAAVFFAAFPIVPRVTVRKASDGSLAAALPLGKDRLVGVSYVHSVNKGAVLDQFEVDADASLVLVRSVFQSFGAGMSDGLEPGVAMRLTPGGVELSGLRRKIGTLRMAVGTVAEHRLRSAGYELLLADRVRAGASVEIAYERISPLQAVRERIRNGSERRR